MYKKTTFLLAFFSVMFVSVSPFWGRGGSSIGSGLAMASAFSGRGASGATGLLSQAAALSNVATSQGAALAGMGMTVAAKQVLKVGEKIRKDVYGPFEKREKTYMLLQSKMQKAEARLMALIEAHLASLIAVSGSEKTEGDGEEEGEDSSDLSWGDDDEESGSNSEDAEEELEKEEPEEKPIEMGARLLKKLHVRLKRFLRDRKVYRMYLRSFLPPPIDGLDPETMEVPYDAQDKAPFFALLDAGSVYEKRARLMGEALAPVAAFGAQKCMMTKEMRHNRDKIPLTLIDAKAFVEENNMATAVQMVTELGKASMPEIDPAMLEQIAQGFDAMRVTEIKFVRIVRKIFHGGSLAPVVEALEKAQKPLFAFTEQALGIESQVAVDDQSIEDEEGEDDDEESFYGEEYEEESDKAGDETEEEQDFRNHAVDIEKFNGLRKAVFSAQIEVLKFFDKAIGRKKPEKLDVEHGEITKETWKKKYAGYKKALLAACERMKEFGRSDLGCDFLSSGFVEYDIAAEALVEEGIDASVYKKRLENLRKKEKELKKDQISTYEKIKREVRIQQKYLFYLVRHALIKIKDDAEAQAAEKAAAVAAAKKAEEAAAAKEDDTALVGEEDEEPVIDDDLEDDDDSDVVGSGDIVIDLEDEDEDE